MRNPDLNRINSAELPKEIGRNLEATIGSLPEVAFKGLESLYLKIRDFAAERL